MMSAELHVLRLPDAAAFLERAGAWLLRAEARNNLMLSLADRMLRGSKIYDQGAYFAVVERAGHIEGCIMRTPPFKLLVTELPADTIGAVVDAVAALYDEIPAVLGPEPAAGSVAREWARRRTLTAARDMEQRIYQLEQVVPPSTLPPGELRLATLADLDLVTYWIENFSEEVKMPTHRARALGEERIRQHELFLWIDGEPRAMVAWAGRTPNAVRIAYVYTPTAHRNRGYATACTAQASQRALDSGYKFCFLFTDLSNPVSNSIYQRLGYAPVADVVDWLIS